MNVDCLDEKSVMTYIACICDALHQRSDAAAAVHRQEVLNCHCTEYNSKLIIDLPDRAVVLAIGLLFATNIVVVVVV